MKRKFPLLAAVLFVTASLSQAWEDSGHLLIGEVASRKLRPEVVKKIEALLPLLDSQYNANRPYNIITVGTWLDDMRKMGREAYPWVRWHYVDVPCTGDRAYSLPQPPHALWALDQATAVLRSPDAGPKARAEALAQVIHIVGDIHQPLHTATRNNDLGGNNVLIAPLVVADSGPTNLHAFWDMVCRYDTQEGNIAELWPRVNLLSRPQGPNTPGIIAEKAATLIAHAPQRPAETPSKKPWYEWARETHMIACESGWPKDLPRENMIPVTLTPQFVHESHEIAMQQVLKAGERLATLLNGILAEDAAKK